MAPILRIPIVVVFEEEGNPYVHRMMRDLAGFRVNNLDEGIAVIEALLMPEGVGTARELPLDPIQDWKVPVLDASQRIAA
jgi:hypothetical protein